MTKRGPIDIRHGANLPHWTREGATYSVTFRLGDSLPRAAIQRLLSLQRTSERKSEVGAALTLEELVRRSREKHDAYMSLLDEGHGECLLARPEVADVVAGALKHFDGSRYRLHAWCVMPNHVHVVFQPLDGHTLPEILHSWKSFTAKQTNRLLGRTGAF